MSEIHILDIATEILQEQNKPMHVNEIAIEAASKNLIYRLTFENFVKKLNSALAANLRTSKPRFDKVENTKGGYRKGIYRLIKRRSASIDLFPTKEPIQTSNTSYLGKAGEMAVMSELLFRDFNVSMMMVDKGIDIIAANEIGKYFHIQVKTTSSSENSYTFTISKKAFDLNNSSQTFYIFVMRSPSKTDYLILPNTILANLIANGVVKGAVSLGIRVIYNKITKKFILNAHTDVSVHINKFAQIN